jgi:hypothetical protein
MALTPKYYIIPHGVLNDGDKIFAAFKMMVTFGEFLLSKQQEVSLADWNEAAKIIDADTWHYKVAPSGAKTILIKRNATETDYKKIEFRAKAVNGIIKKNNSFAFGRRFSGTTMESSFGFLARQKFHLPASGGAASEEAVLAQFEPVPSATSGDTPEPDYTAILQSANAYARQRNFKASAVADAETGLNVKAVYASLLDEPLAAEVQYGLIREFLVDVSEITQQDAAFTYAINLEGHDEGNSGQIYRFEKRTVAGVAKYYNGLHKICFKADDFKAVRYEFTDPYKNQLESEKGKNHLHPDGIYIIGVYIPKGATLADPFNEAGIKGFNALVKDDKGALFSLTMHSKVLTFPGTGKLTIAKEPGYLTARSEIKTETTDFRSNVLLVWRGDNLAVNRIPADLEKDDAREMEEGKGKLESIQEYCAEDNFVRKYLLDKAEHLVPGTQTQLLAGKKYEFIFRTVTPTHHCVPFKTELTAAQMQYTLTMEDMGNDIKSLLGPVDFNVQGIDMIPVKSLSIIGPNKYDDATSDFVDKPRHLVLNKIRKETTESRYIYPPAIKLEDLRMLGFMTVDAMTVAGKKPTRDEFVARCKQLENKATAIIPKIYPGALPISYLGDPRGTHLYVVPADLFTASQVKAGNVNAFPHESTFPFYNRVLAREIRASIKGTDTQLSFIGSNTAGTVTYSKLIDGIYNFNIYCTNAPLQGTGIAEALQKFNATPVRITILNYPEKPSVAQTKHEAVRYTGADKHYWYMDLPVTKESSTWKSIKYLEQTKVLKLQHEDLDDLLNDYIARGGKREEFLENEYPYGMFLRDQGSINAKQGLMQFIYPAEVSLKYKVPASLKDTGSFFRIRLNDEETLEARYDNKNGSELRFGDLKVTGNTFSLTILFRPSENCYVIMKDGAEWVKLKKYINADISIRDLEISDEVLPFIQFDNTGLLQFERSGKYVFIVDQRDPYFYAKKVKLFGSSPFQAYFPSVKTEYSLGSEGAVLDLKIPNNTLPEPPVVEAKILLMHEKSATWNDPGSLDIKENKTESLVRLTLQQDFMKEGRNKLGIVVAKVPDDENETMANVSRIGEDITKLTSTDWSSTTLKNLLNFDLAKTVLKKYCPVGQTNFYRIGPTVYEVIELDPYYNADLKKWQVVLPFRFFQSSEVLFLKLICLKIAPGHGLQKAKADPSSPTNPFVDTTNTNLSVFGDAVQLPVYSRKVIRVTRTRQGAKNAYTIKVNSQSGWKNKCYFVMFSMDDPEEELLNKKDPKDNDKFSSLVSFTLDPGGTKPDRGKVLVFKDQDEVTISRENCYSILVLECEIHENAEMVFAEKPAFITNNPFFEIKGVRPINVMEFIA